MNVWKRIELTLLLVLAAAPVARAQNACTVNHRPDRIRVHLVRPASTMVVARKNGDDRPPVPLNGTNNVLTGPGFREAMKDVMLCSQIKGYASECVPAMPSPEFEGQAPNRTFVCYADYIFQCANPAWTLSVDSNPRGLRIVFERTTDGVRQHATITAAPNTHLEDIGYNEQIHITDVDATRTTIDVKFQDFDANKRTIERDVVPADPPTGNRALGTSQNEQLLKTPRKIIFRIDGGI